MAAGVGSADAIRALGEVGFTAIEAVDEGRKSMRNLKNYVLNLRSSVRDMERTIDQWPDEARDELGGVKEMLEDKLADWRKAKDEGLARIPEEEAWMHGLELQMSSARQV